MNMKIIFIFLERENEYSIYKVERRKIFQPCLSVCKNPFKYLAQ